MYLTFVDVVKVVALGWCFGEKTYLKSSWNVLDGMLVMISVIDILVSLIFNSGTKILGMLRVLRLLRTLRPLRYADHNIHSVLHLVITLNNSYNYIKALMHKCTTTCLAGGNISTYTVCTLGQNARFAHLKSASTFLQEA